MEFLFTESQAAINEAARDMLVETATTESYRALLETGFSFDDNRWSTICDMGLLAILVPEDKGGLGLAMPDLIAIAEAAGYVGLPEPLIDHAGIIAPLLASLADDRGWLARVLAGETIMLGHLSNSLVSGPDNASALLLSDGQDLHLVDRKDVQLTRRESLDPLRNLYEVEWTPSPATLIPEGWGDSFERGALLAAAQLVGLGQRCIDISVAYTKDREQFGKAIGSYQAVKHMIAQPQVKIEFARPVVLAAAAELANGNLAARARIAHAKIAAGEAADLAARNAVQAHGAMGITWEVDLHFFFKRVLALNYHWGSPAQHLRTVSERISSLPIGPDTTFASTLAVS